MRDRGRGEVVQRRVEDHVHEHAAAGEVDADRQAVWEVPDGPPLADAGRDVRQLFGSDPELTFPDACAPR
jgi:hypothetical protein